MERMTDGQDSRARWKSAVLGLPHDRSRIYLRDVEGYGPDQIRRLLDGDDATIVPDDWDVTEESKQALARYEAWEQSGESGDDAAQDEYQEARGAALPPQEGSPAKPGMTEEAHE